MPSLRLLSGRNFIVSATLAVALVLFIGCAGSSPEEPAAPAATSAPAAQESAPTAVPASAGSAPAMSDEVSGMVTMMVADWGTQAFEPRDASGQIMTQHRMLHGWLIAGNEKTEMIPGIAQSWELSEDGLQWTWTIRDGVKFHNGDDLTIDDIQFTLDRHHGPEAAENAIHSIFIQQSKRTVSQEITGPNTIVVTQTEPNATYPFLNVPASFVRRPRRRAAQELLGIRRRQGGLGSRARRRRAPDADRLQAVGADALRAVR